MTMHSVNRPFIKEQRVLYLLESRLARPSKVRIINEPSYAKPQPILVKPHYSSLS